MANNKAKKDILLETGTNEVELAEFFLGESSYGVNVAKIREFVPYDIKTVTKVPNSPHSMLGMLLLRGKTIPLVDLKQNLEQQDDVVSERPVVLVTEFNSLTNGFLIDSINQIHRLSWSDIKPLNQLISGHSPRITGTVHIKGREILILDLEYIIGRLFPEQMSRLTEYESDEHAPQVHESLQEKRNKCPVVIAEDSGMIRKLIINALKKEGYININDFDNGLSAYHYLSNLKQEAEANNQSISELLSIVVSDIEMPQMDGLNLCKRIKEDTGFSGVPVILFSSLINEQMIKKCKQVGADGQISKPEMKKMITYIDEILGLSENENNDEE
ncbi:Chemotaxis protein CheV [Candidatus Magnetomorum sp. HK-1]|nr:Chemotaxis protein CheV [Candidatus Magnetomorum sp. HK-1]